MYSFQNSNDFILIYTLNLTRANQTGYKPLVTAFIIFPLYPVSAVRPSSVTDNLRVVVWHLGLWQVTVTSHHDELPLYRRKENNF